MGTWANTNVCKHGWRKLSQSWVSIASTGKGEKGTECGETSTVSKLRLLSSSSLSTKEQRRWVQYHSSPPSIQMVRNRGDRYTTSVYKCNYLLTFRQNCSSYLKNLFKYDLFIFLYFYKKKLNKTMVKGDVKVHKYFQRVGPTRNPHAHNDGGRGARTWEGAHAQGPACWNVAWVGTHVSVRGWVRDIPPRVITSPVALPTSALLTSLQLTGGFVSYCSYSIMNLIYS
jgi:hypothetical protein